MPALLRVGDAYLALSLGNAIYLPLWLLFWMMVMMTLLLTLLSSLLLLLPQ